ncbi:unnamed protein product [Microthlaspi erraticum]|uniref:Integrase catalytic domain-containing protein n=2 Tax=Microthlaspi erraticum TaxID=1685480 RepID=A0A6D2J1Q4_9BRAS|nr:unnamed protein product [Microthlaspi erraticum]
MHPDDREKTAFITDRGTYCYKVMPFGLKNAGATYQRLVNKMFADQLGRSMEVYIDDMLVKSAKARSRQAPQRMFPNLREYGMKLNPAKCTFAVTSGEFLGYVVTQRGIEANPKQISAILDLPSPTSSKEIQRLTGRIAALNRFISRSTDKCSPSTNYFDQTRSSSGTKNAKTLSNNLKEYLTTPPILAKPEEGETLLLYIAISSTAVSGVLVREDRGEQQPVFYVSKTLNDAETRYPTLEKLALAPTTTPNPSRPQPIRKNGRWAIELSEYDIEFKSRTSAKSQVLADFIVEIPPELATQEDEQILKWTLHVDGSSSRQGAGVGIRLVSPTGEILEQSIKLGFPASNNEAEYEAIIAGLRLAEAVGAEHVRAFCDSQLVAKQFSGDYDTKDDRMDAYLKQTQRFQSQDVLENSEADALAALASKTESALRRVIPVETIDEPSIKLPKGTVVMAISQEEEEDENLTDDESAEHKSWQDEIRNYLINDAVPEERWAARRLRRKAAYYFLRNNELFRWSANKVILRCCDEAQAKSIMVETHEGASGNHAGGRSLALKIKKIGYFWPTMIGDCINVAAKCVPCKDTHRRSTPQRKHFKLRSRHIPLCAGEWISSAPCHAHGNALTSWSNFVWQYIICRHGLPYEIVTDNGGQFVAAAFREFCASWNIKITYSTPRYPQANGQAESTNKTIVDGLKKRLEGYQGAWADELDGVLWSHRTTPRTASGETPFSLSHGCEALAPAELHVASLRRSLMPLNPALNDDSLLHSLDHTEELRDRALLRMQNYQQQATRYYDRKVRNRRFELYDLVSKKVHDFTKPEHAGKFGFHWEGPFRITKIIKPGVYELDDCHGNPLPRPWNSMNLRRFYT